jgi:adenine-specific DNA-methyltransferase
MTSQIKKGKIWFGEHGNNVPRIKTYLHAKERGLTPESILFASEASTNERAKIELKRYFGGDASFVTPKPVKLIELLLRMGSDKDSIILDSFAGSGTTAHAVLNLNKKENANRKFILVELEDYAENITSQRIKTVISGYGKNSKKVEGADGDFNYYKLGQPIFKEEGFLNEEVGEENIRRYVWFSETKADYQIPKEQEPFLLGKNGETAYYFYYRKEGLTTLDEAFLRTIKTKAEQYIIYADNCLLDEKLMAKYHIIFKKNTPGYYQVLNHNKWN